MALCRQIMNFVTQIGNPLIPSKGSLNLSFFEDLVYCMKVKNDLKAGRYEV